MGHTLDRSLSRTPAAAVTVGPPAVAEDVDPEKLAGYPTLRRAAQLLKLDPATLSRRADVRERAIRRGRELLLPPDLTLGLAAHYRKRRLGEVASDLIDLAVAGAPAHVDEIEDEVDAALEENRRPAAADREAEAFLKEAKRALPAALYAQVADAYNADAPITAGSAYRGDD